MTRSETARLIFTVIGIQAFEDLFSSLSVGGWYLYFAIVTLWFWRSSHRLPLWLLGAGAVAAMGHCTVELAGFAERSDNLLFAFGYLVTVFIAIAAEAGEPTPA